MNLFATSGFNGKFMRPNSSLPIAGTVASTAFNRVLTEAKVSTGGNIITQGMSVVVSNKQGSQTASVNGGSNLAPNVLTATYSTDTANAFIVDNANAVVLNGDDFPQVLDNQVVRVALIGSGAEVYLPCDNTVIGASNPIYWDVTNQKLISAEAASKPAKSVVFTGVILSQVVDGIKSKISSGTVTTEPCSVVKVKL